MAEIVKSESREVFSYNFAWSGLSKALISFNIQFGCHQIWFKLSELRMKLAPWNRFKPSSKIFLLTVARWYFFCRSFMLFLSCVCYAFVRVCLLMPCGHLLGKGWPLGSRLWCLIVSLLLSHHYPGSGVVLDCIDSWFLPSFYFLKCMVD